MAALQDSLKGHGLFAIGADMHACPIRRKLREAGVSSIALETIHGQGCALRLCQGSLAPGPNAG